MRPNINPDTGIAYGVINARTLDDDTFHHLTYENGTDLTYNEAYAELQAEITAAADALEAEVRDESEGADEEATASLIEAAYERAGYQDRLDYIETRLEQEVEQIQIDEPVWEGESQGVRYRVTWLGGAQIVFIFHSPTVVRARQCSPCAPNAGDLDNLDDSGIECYGVPADWLAD